ncbi:universal stress protein [Nocardioides zhouii]|uniref:Universal stress protein n=1 Tax=Nocardioides zhouii TaxID=1168729 RepID=A0A4V1RQM6_9ACTN|nr:universal stress protein [Nocardioides zhouii]
MPSGEGLPRRGVPTGTGRTCLVAVDDSESAVKALVWAFRHAARGDMSVEVLTVWPSHRAAFVHEVPGHFNEARWSARRAQAAAVRRALEVVSEGSVPATRLENAEPAGAILRASAWCDLVVLGSDPLDSSHSLTESVIAHAGCDVMVVR